MTTELTVLAWGCVLALVHIFAAAQVKTKQYGIKWNAGPRDESLPEPLPVTGRLMRAQANFFETFPIVIALIAIRGCGSAHVSSICRFTRWGFPSCGRWLSPLAWLASS